MPDGSTACTPQVWLATWVMRRSTQVLASASAAALPRPNRDCIQQTIASSASPMAALRSASKPNVIRPPGVSAWIELSGRSPGEVDHGLGGHPALDGGAADLPVALCRVAVAQVEQRARNGHGQEQGCSGDKLLAVDVAAARRPRRDGGVLAWLGRRHAHHAQERRQAAGKAAV